MDSRHKILLKKYWEGHTTPEEELQLFSADPHWHSKDDIDIEEATYFEILSQYRQTKLNLSDDDIMQNIRPVDLDKKKTRRVIGFFKYAAAVLIIISLGYTYLSNNQSEAIDSMEKQEAMEAYAITKDMLLFMSAELNKGEIYTYPINEFEETIKKLKSENL